MLSFAFYCKLSCSNMLPLLSSDDSTLVCCSCGSVLSQVCTHCSKTFFPATVSCSCCVPNLSQKLGFDAAFAEAVKEQAPIWVAPQMTTPPRPGQAQTSSRLAGGASPCSKPASRSSLRPKSFLV